MFFYSVFFTQKFRLNIKIKAEVFSLLPTYSKLWTFSRTWFGDVKIGNISWFDDVIVTVLISCLYSVTLKKISRFFGHIIIRISWFISFEFWFILLLHFNHFNVTCKKISWCYRVTVEKISSCYTTMFTEVTLNKDDNIHKSEALKR